MNEQYRDSRAEITVGVGDEQHVSASVVTINGGVNSDIHIVAPKNITINTGVNNNYIIYTDDANSVLVTENGCVNSTIEYRALSTYHKETKASTKTTGSSAEGSIAVGAGQVYISGEISTGINHNSNRSIPERKFKDAATQNYFNWIDNNELGLEECAIDEEEATALGIRSGQYFLDYNLSTSPRVIGGEAYSLVTTSLVKSGTVIGLGGGRLGYAVQKDGKYLYTRS